VAVVEDAEELVRLRHVMLSSFDHVPAGPWEDTAVETLQERLPEEDPTLVAFVIDRPGGLAACAVGTVEYRLGGPKNPSGEVGYVFNVSTDPDYRRRGYARACMEALIQWYAERGITKIDLKASPDGEPLYSSLGFVRTPDPAMRMTLG
jgi:RimJ/RimL family protein N-acetyltransferase